MLPNLNARIAYGRSIRARADCLLEAHGPAAAVEASRAASEPGVTDVERAFWEAVAERIERLGRGLAA